MNPMTELDVLKGLQASIAGLDLESPMAVESAMALGASMERSAGRIVSPDRCACGEDCVHPSHHTGNDAMRAIADEPPFSEEPFADQIGQTIAARKAQTFKVGDRVRMVGDSNPSILTGIPYYRRGDIGVVSAPFGPSWKIDFEGQGNMSVYAGGPWAAPLQNMEHADTIPVNNTAEDAQMDEIEAHWVDLAKPEVFDIVGFTQTYFGKGA